jgi:hypothetical protein
LISPPASAVEKAVDFEKADAYRKLSGGLTNPPEIAETPPC